MNLAATLEAYRPAAIRVAYAILHNQADAEDAVQDAYLRAFRFKAAYRGDAVPETWLHRIVHNQALDLWRKQTARCAKLHETIGPNVPAIGNFETEYAKTESIAAILVAVASLTPAEQLELLTIGVKCHDRTNTQKTRRLRAIVKVQRALRVAA